jgi:hypothetical protein
MRTFKKRFGKEGSVMGSPAKKLVKIAHPLINSPSESTFLAINDVSPVP